MPVTMTITRADGTVETFDSAAPVKQWLALAASNSAVADVMRILASGVLDWVNLYRILEQIENDVGGLDAIYKNKLASKKSIKCFKRTANSFDVLGLEARHGPKNQQPPANPMMIAEARSLITSMIHAWLRAQAPRS
jgi:hypothetical protein